MCSSDLLFGLPFITLMLAGSFFLTPATALRYEKHDRKVTQMGKEEALNVGKNKRKVDMKEEYYVRLTVSATLGTSTGRPAADLNRDLRRRISTTGSRGE